jgi:hypothetical protein
MLPYDHYIIIVENKQAKSIPLNRHKPTANNGS